ncbi:hypothetical protein VTJ49DRAFT_2136 [Mycothermus thermophilus]|uniref:FAD synthase middle domain-containing protein n=1 Tax=Humicola insolens TaxID=85995 RepID=A0ABR3VP24_HUMIN
MKTASENAARTIHTAACLIIGDETKDTNSHCFAKWCFDLGIRRHRADVSQPSSPLTLLAKLTFHPAPLTSHDDITYQSIAKAFGLPLVLHQQAFELMKKLSRQHPGQPNFRWDEDSPALRAKLRMVEIPTDPSRSLAEQAVFPCEDAWVPVAIVNGNVHILPGVPKLFEKLLQGLTPRILPRLSDPRGKGIVRVSISTPMPESAIAAYLTELAARVQSRGVKVGSYPRWGKTRNTVTLVGRDQEFLNSIAPEVAQAVNGKVVQTEGEDDDESEKDKDKEEEDAAKEGKAEAKPHEADKRK